MESKTSKKTAQSLIIKNKVLFIFCISFIIVSLFFVCYLFFFRSITIDANKYINVEYSGESGSATVKIQSDVQHFNQRTQEFLETLTYTATPNANLSNGTIVHVQATYSQALANKYNIKVINETSEFVVEGLSQRYENANDISSDFLELLDKRAQDFMDKNLSTILEKDFPDFYITSDTKLKEKKRLARVFLQATNKDNKDKIVDVYAITASGQVNKAVDKEDLKEEERTIYYGIIYDNINNSKHLKESDITGEKFINVTIDMSKPKSLEEALRSKFLLTYTFQEIK